MSWLQKDVPPLAECVDDFDALAGFDELAMIRAENARLRAENEALKREKLDLKLELRQMGLAFDQAQAILHSVPVKTNAKVIREVFQRARDVLELAFNPLNLPREQFLGLDAA